MNAAAQLGIIAVIAVAAAGGTRLVKGPVGKTSIPECHRSTLGEGEICPADVAGNVLWIDARSRAEWEKNGVKGSILWNLDPRENANEMEAAAAMLIAGGVDQVIVYCSSEACGTSKQIAERIRALGLGTPVKTLRGGWDALKGSNPSP